jgi:hypothetical protein
LAISNISTLEILAIRSVTVTDVLIIIVLGVGFIALFFPNRAIFI